MQNDDHLEELEHARTLAQGFISGDTGFAQFYPQLSRILGSTFDDVESMTHDFPEAVRREVRFYSDWTGGEWGETRDRIPKRRNWKYGEDLEPYGWIDKRAYRDEFAKSYQDLKLADLDTLRGA